MFQIFTIGYEGANVEDLVQTLVNNRIKVLADVRELPLSRKKGFSKKAFAHRLNEAGIEYKHYRDLGDPKMGRDAAKAGDLDTFVKVFSNHIQKPSAQNAMDDLFKVASQKLTCMMCFERCASVCHRSMIANFAVKSGFEVLNLVADRPKEYLNEGIKIPRHDPSKSLTAAEQEI